jgi:type VI secretion system protein ImpC
MSRNESQQGGTTETVVLDAHQEVPVGHGNSVYEALCSKINLKPVSAARPLEAFRDPAHVLQPVHAPAGSGGL